MFKLLSRKYLSRIILFRKYREILINSGYFDKEFYLEHYPDVRAMLHDPLKHYFFYGADEMRDPGPDFSTAFYVQNYPDVKINPLLHYILYGKDEKRIAKPEYDPVNGIITEKNNLFFRKNAKEDYNIKNDIKLIRESGLFDSVKYLKANQDVRENNIDPLEHFCFFGWKEMRNPNPDFDVYFYLQSNIDVKESGINPLVHYYKYGRSEDRLTKELVTDNDECAQRADIATSKNDLKDYSHLRIAVVFHVYYPDLLEEFVRYLKNISWDYDLYISATKENVDLIRDYLSQNLKKNPEILVFENKGRDIGPFIEIYKEKLKAYDLALKIHTKKSSHNYNLRNWREFLLNNLLGSSEIIDSIISEFVDDQKLGMIFPVPHPYLVHIGFDKGWGKNDYKLALKLGLNIDFEKYKKSNFDFPAGSMFWFRPEAFNLIREALLTNSDFEQGLNKEDSTLAHVAERVFGIVPVEAGYDIKSIYFGNKFLQSGLKPDNWLSESKTILFISHDLFRAGAEMILYNIVKWFRRYTGYKVYVMAISIGGDGGKLRNFFEKLVPVYVWEELLEEMNSGEIVNYLLKEIGEINLIYGNTIKAPVLYPVLKEFNAPFVTHVHELEQSINKYVLSEIVQNFKDYSKLVIACSEAVKANLVTNHNIPGRKISLVYEFIEPQNASNDLKRLVRKSAGIENDKVIIWGCGAIYWRKGVDIFIETARKLRDKGMDNFCFYWIGGNYWKDETGQYGTWNFWKQYMVDNDLQDHVYFIGEKQNAQQYYTDGDIFYLPSREDPFPLVCLEAAAQGLPVICFDKAGGMPEFVAEDAGLVLPFLDIDAVVDGISELLQNEERRIKLGLNAKKKVLRNYTSEISVPRVLNICNEAMNNQPLVSVIIPVYNQEGFIRDRIGSVLNQTFRDYEIIVIDDCSNDNSYDVALEFRKHPQVKVFRNQKNSGSVFKQWRKGCHMARGKFVWIAEGDDTAHPEFLETLLFCFNDPEVGLAYSASSAMDENGNIDRDYYFKSGHYKNLGFPSEKFSEDYVGNGEQEIINALSIRNTIPNASAVLLRKSLILSLDFDKLESFRSAGDWYAYTEIIRDNKIAYSAKHLNNHRIHSSSKVGREKLKAELTLPDYFKVHKHIVSGFPVSAGVLDVMTKSVSKELRGLWPGLSDKDFKEYYNIDILHEILDKKTT